MRTLRLMPRRVKTSWAGERVPQADGPVPPGRGQREAVGAEGQAQHAAHMPPQRGSSLRQGHVPQRHVPALMSRGQGLAVRGDRQGVDSIVRASRRLESDRRTSPSIESSCHRKPRTGSYPSGEKATAWIFSVWPIRGGESS